MLSVSAKLRRIVAQDVGRYYPDVSERQDEDFLQDPSGKALWRLVAVREDSGTFDLLNHLVYVYEVRDPRPRGYWYDTHLAHLYLPGSKAVRDSADTLAGTSLTTYDRSSAVDYVVVDEVQDGLVTTPFSAYEVRPFVDDQWCPLLGGTATEQQVLAFYQTAWDMTCQIDFMGGLPEGPNPFLSPQFSPILARVRGWFSATNPEAVGSAMKAMRRLAVVAEALQSYLPTTLPGGRMNTPRSMAGTGRIGSPLHRWFAELQQFRTAFLHSLGGRLFGNRTGEVLKSHSAVHRVLIGVETEEGLAGLQRICGWCRSPSQTTPLTVLFGRVDYVRFAKYLPKTGTVGGSKW